MLLTYMDESASPKYRFLGGVVVPPHQAIHLTRALDDVVLEAQATFGRIRDDEELHGNPLFTGSEAWEHVPPRGRIWIYDKAFQAIAAHDVTIFLRGVHLDRLKSKYSYLANLDAHSVVMTQILERINDYSKLKTEPALIICDEVGDPSRYRKDLAHYRQSKTWGYRPSDLAWIADTIHFAPSWASRLLQAADLVVYLHRRRYCVTEKDPRAAKACEQIWARIMPSIQHEFCWHPQ